MMKQVAFWSLALLIMACGGEEKPAGKKDSDEKPVAKVEEPAIDGEKIFKTYCITCHGIDGKMGLNGAKDLGLAETTLEERVDQITNGKNLMTAFAGILTPEEIEAVAQYTFEFKDK